MRSSHSLDAIAVTFDDERLVADAGLMLPATLAQHLGLRELFDDHVDLGDAAGHANVGHKAMTLVHSALAGGDSIDDCDALRAGSTQAVLGHAVLAPSTLGTFLRSFTWGHVRQLDKVAGELLGRAWAAGAGPGEAPFTIDVDSSIVETYGLKKQGGTKFTYNKVRGYHPLMAVVAGTGDVVHCRQRGGNANSGRGAAGFLTETFNRARAAGASGPITLRADSGFYSGTVASACRAADVRFSITVKLNPAIRKAIATIPEDAWVAIPYFLDGADVAETTYRPFGRKAPLVRLIVRRTKPTPGSQLALLVDYAYHALVTDRVGETIAIEADHRRHAVVEDTIRDLKYGVGLNHMPSGRFGANAAWLGLNVIAHNLARWTSRVGLGETLIATDTLRRRYLRTPGRITFSARKFTLHMPKRWPWAERFDSSLANLRAVVVVT
ncbi:MAG: IS1380 family transposase [Actinomycetota bacterium]|nr:IS1380 family transposase [Actinomycetota bacterium]